MTRLTAPLLTIVILAGCGKEPEHRQLSKPVSVMPLHVSSPQRELRLTGAVEPWKSESLGFEVSGKVTDTRELGELVTGRATGKDDRVLRAGDVIARIEPVRYAIAVSAAKARVTGARAALTEATLEYNRNKQLLESKSVSQSQFDSAEASYLTAKAELQQAQASLADAIHDLESCNLRAPFDGQIEEVTVSPGAWVQPGQAIVKLTMMMPIRVNVPISADLSRQLSPGDGILVYPPGSDEPQAGWIESSGVAADPATRTFTMYVFIKNARVPAKQLNEKQQLLPKVTEEGIDIVLHHTLDDTNTPLSVPMAAVKKDDAGYYVWRGKGQRILASGETLSREFQVERVPVVPGTNYRKVIYQTFRDLIDPGTLEGYDLIVTEPPADLKDGDTLVMDQRRWLFRPGDVVQVRVTSLARPDGIYVPMSAIVPDASGRPYVYLVEDGKAKRVEVDLVGEHGEFRGIAGPGIKDGAKLILRGAHYVTDSEPVTIVEI